MDDLRTRENRVRREAARQGFRLVKSRRRNPYAPDFGSYWIVDNDTNGLVAGDECGWDLDDIEERLALLSTTPKRRSEPVDPSRSKVTSWSEQLQKFTGTLPIDDLSNEQVEHLWGAVTYLYDCMAIEMKERGITNGHKQ